jgi:hypothetical protein
MVKLRNLDKIWEVPAGTRVNVGHNLDIEPRLRDDGFKVFDCYLHGSTVSRVLPHGSSGGASVWLDDCGYLTATTIAAMNDFMRAFGIRGSASRAGGKLSVRFVLHGEWHKRESSDGSLRFAADRYPA